METPWKVAGYTALFCALMFMLALFMAGIASEYDERLDEITCDDVVVEMGMEVKAEHLSATIAQLNEAIGDGLLACRIDAVFRSHGSPMTGTGYIFVRESKRTGVNPFLPAAIAGKESTFGLRCFAPHNAWGMLAYPSGWSTWEAGIVASFNWLHGYYGAVRSPYGCGGYCVPNHPWMEDVAAIMGGF